MKICHFSDSHLGAGESHPRRGPSGLTARQEDIINSFVQVVDDIITIGPDVCVHSGDLFHSVRPLNRIMAIAAQQLHRLTVDAGVPMVIITGNHDAPKQPFVGAALEVFQQIDNLHVASGGELKVFSIGGGRFFALPHCLTVAMTREQTSLCVPDPHGRWNVLIAHGVAAGMPEFSMADLGEQELPLELLERFDYAALGHFHNYCQVAARAYYAGSTERLSQAEREAAKGFLEVDLEPFRVTFHEICTRQMVDLQTINAAGKRGDQLAQIIRDKLEEVDSSDKIIRVRVEGVTPETLKTLPAEAIAEMKQNSYSLDIRFQREDDEEGEARFSRPAVGQLDRSFAQFLDTADLRGFDREQLLREAIKYLRAEE